MTSKDVKDLLKSDAGKTKLYFNNKKRFDLVDSLMLEFAEGDILDKTRLENAMDKLTGCYGIFVTICDAVDAYKTNQELDYTAKAFQGEGKKVVSQITELARASTQELREIRADFLSYCKACEKGIGTCQSRLKKLSVESGARRTDYVGDQPTEDIVKESYTPPIESTTLPETETVSSGCGTDEKIEWDE